MGQVVVDGHDVHVAAGNGIARGRDRAGQRFPLTGGHLDHVAGQHAQGTEQLHIKWPQPGRPFGGFPGDRQELRDVVGLGEIGQVEQARRLAQLFVVEVGGILVEVRRVGHLGHRTASVLLRTGA